jgi:hypothetical protein
MPPDADDVALVACLARPHRPRCATRRSTPTPSSASSRCRGASATLFEDRRLAWRHSCARRNAAPAPHNMAPTRPTEIAMISQYWPGKTPR